MGIEKRKRINKMKTLARGRKVWKTLMQKDKQSKKVKEPKKKLYDTKQN